jgi:hypothetical protein
MHIDVVLTAEELGQILRAAAPLRIHLTETDEDRRWVEVEQPTEVSLVANLGLRMVSSGRIRYELAGFRPMFSIRRLQLLCVPQVVSVSATHERLDFQLILEEADVVNVPGFADRALVNAVNEALTPGRLGLSWDFGRALQRAIGMPARFEPLDQLLLGPPAGRVTIGEDALRFSVALPFTFARSKPRPTDPAPEG